MADHTTVWFPLGPAHHPVIAAAGLTEPVGLPLFVDGPEFEKFEATRQVEISPKALLFGVLLHAQETVPGVDTVALRRHAPALLDVLARGFGIDGVERLVCDVALHLRSRHGIDYGLAVLENGLVLFPNFHRVRSDLASTLWLLAEKAPEAERPALLERLLKAFADLDRRDLWPGPRAVVCYAAVAATAALKGLPAAIDLFGELAPEIRAGDEGQLVKNLETFLAHEGVAWSTLRVRLH